MRKHDLLMTLVNNINEIYLTVVSLRFGLLFWLWFRCGLGCCSGCGFTAVWAVVLAVVSMQFRLLFSLRFAAVWAAVSGCGFAAVWVVVLAVVSLRFGLLF